MVGMLELFCLVFFLTSNKVFNSAPITILTFGVGRGCDPLKVMTYYPN